MIEIKFTGYADVVRKEMLQLLGMEQAPALLHALYTLKDEPAEGGPFKSEYENPVPDAPVVEPVAPKNAPPKATKAKEAPVAAPLEPTASEPEPTAPSAAASAEPTPAPVAENQPVTELTAAPATEHTWDEVRAAIETFGKARGPKPLIEFVRSFDVQRASQIPKEKYGEVLARLATAA